MARVHHTNIRITDAERSLAFYRAVGLEHRGTLQMGPGYTLLYMADDAGLAIELVVNSVADASYDRTPGSGHIGFEVDDLDVSLKALAELGYPAEAVPMHPADRQDLNPIAFVRDPDNVRIELLQRPWPIPQDAVPEDLRHVCGEL